MARVARIDGRIVIVDDEEIEPVTQTEEAEVTEEPGSTADTPKGKGGKKRAKAQARRLRRWLIACLAALAVALAGFGVALALAVSWHGSTKTVIRTVTSAAPPAGDALRQSALDTAKKFALDFSTYDYRNIDADFARISAELTPSFRSQYQTTSASLKSIVVQYRGVATATVQGIGVTSISNSQAVVVVFLDQQVTNSSTKTPRIDRNRLQITLQRNGDGWLMSDLQLK